MGPEATVLVVAARAGVAVAGLHWEMESSELEKEGQLVGRSWQPAVAVVMTVTVALAAAVKVAGARDEAVMVAVKEEDSEAKEVE